MDQRLFRVEEPILSHASGKIVITWSGRQRRPRRRSECQNERLVIGHSRREARENSWSIRCDVRKLAQGLNGRSALTVVKHATRQKSIEVGAKVCVNCAYVCVGI